MWELQPLKQILRRGLRANAFDQTVDVDLSSATRISQQHPTEDQKIRRLAGSSIVHNDQEASIILSSPVSLPSPIAAMDVMEAKAKDAPRLDAACQVQLSGRDSIIEQEPPPPPSHVDLPSPSPPASPPPSPPQESLEETSTEDSKSYSSEFSSSEGESLNATAATGALPPPPPPPPPPANDNDCSDQGYTGSFDSLSLSSKD